jgi:hypothetical protein
MKARPPSKYLGTCVDANVYIYMSMYEYMYEYMYAYMYVNMMLEADHGLASAQSRNKHELTFAK